MIKALFSGQKIYSNSEEAFSLQEKSCFGEKTKNKVEYSLVEALFLVSENRMEVQTKSKILTEEELLKKLLRLDKKIESKLTVFTDLREKGYIVKTALKFGADFRVYNKGVKPGADHALWILYVVKDSELLKWQDFTAKNRVAHSTKKNLLIAIVDEESDISYYESRWLRP